MSRLAYTYTVGAHCYALYIGAPKGTDSHGGYLYSWPRCLRRALWAFVSFSGDQYGDGISISYAPDTEPTQMQIRKRYLQVWPTPDKILTEVHTPMNDALPQLPPTTDARPRKQDNWRLPSDKQFGVHNLRQSESCEELTSQLDKTLRGDPQLAGGGVLWTPIRREKSGTFQPRRALAGPN